MKTRNWLLTINYKTVPAPKTHDEIIKTLHDNFKNITYYFIQLESGKNRVIHHHILLCLLHPIHITSIKNKFPRANIKALKGDMNNVKQYLDKSNKIIKPAEYGQIPKQGARTDWNNVVNFLKEGNTPFNARDLFPDIYLKHRTTIHQIYQEIMDETLNGLRIKKEVTYIYGEPGTGKTRSVLDKHGDKNVYRVTDYDHPFDQYNGQDVMVFEEFRSSLKIEQMLNYLDIYSQRLPARYNNRVAAYTKVYIVTNIPIIDQYHNLIENYPTTYQAFLRRIDKAQMFIWKKGKKEVHIETFDDINFNMFYHMTIHNKKNERSCSNIKADWLSEEYKEDDVLELQTKIDDLTGKDEVVQTEQILEIKQNFDYLFK